MPYSRLLGHALVVSYLVVVALGTAQAVKRTDFVPLGRITIFMYGMLAPYQGYLVTTEGYVAEGSIDGEWKKIDLAPYYPVLAGERSMREQHTYANWAHFPSSEDAYRAYAEKLLAVERDAGRPYEQLRLSWIQWRPTPAGFRDGTERPLQSVVLVTVQ